MVKLLLEYGGAGALLERDCELRTPRDVIRDGVQQKNFDQLIAETLPLLRQVELVREARSFAVSCSASPHSLTSSHSLSYTVPPLLLHCSLARSVHFAETQRALFLYYPATLWSISSG